MGTRTTSQATLNSGPTRPMVADLSESAGDVGRLVMSAADGNGGAWHELVGRLSPLVTTMARAHRLTAEDTTEVSDMVWVLLARQLSQLRRPDRVGAWLSAVTRDECVRRIMAST